MKETHAEMLDLLRFIASGIARKKIKDVSVIPRAPPGVTEMDLTTLSAMVNATIAKAENAVNSQTTPEAKP